MDNSSENVTLYAWAITDILKNYQDKKQDYWELFELAKGIDLSKPNNKVPIKVYVDMCNWIEQKLGKFNLIKIGRNIGESTYQMMIENKMITVDSSPFDIMKALILTAQKGVQDPKKRGWEVIEHTEKSITMRKTQIFNTSIQLGMLDALIRKSKVFGIQVNLIKEAGKGSEFDEYSITWL
ncbi:MAG: hypothetical protein H6537_02780 [Bacteroidales bacterium]|nr:hypothetical protein [Bacteroidales bacterium]HPD96395.1 hypothetical protein [Tenuifilaceae bacterium]HRX32434.1 hypothetical protein [Tenuifilaceae bacterium]